MPKPKIGEILVRRNAITAAALKEALLAQGASLLPLGSTMVRLGTASEEDVVLALAEQHGVPGVVLSKSTIQCEALGLVPERIASGHRILPMAVEGATLKVALANPVDQVLLDEIAFASGKKTLPFVAVRSTLEDAVRRGYRAKGEGAVLSPGAECTHEEVHLEVV